mgnify:FL=1
MPLPRYPESIMQAIRAKYCPVIPGPKPKDGSDRPMIQDPLVLYVGPITDGICLYAPEITGRATWPSEGGVENRRPRLKHLLSNTGASGRAMNWNSRNSRLTFIREGKGPVALASRLLEAEPGELMNSFEMIQDPETGEIAPWELLRRRDESLATTHLGERPARQFEPTIREDKRYGLHYLRRGDKLVFEYTHRRAGLIRMEFELKPLSEGSSILTPAQSTGTPEW